MSRSCGTGVDHTFQELAIKVRRKIECWHGALWKGEIQNVSKGGMGEKESNTECNLKYAIEIHEKFARETVLPSIA